MHTAVKFKTAALAALLALAGPSLAQTLPTVPPEVLPQVKVDLSSEAAGCGLYYTLAANIIERDFPDKDTTQMREAAKASTAMAAMPVSKEVANANLQMANDDMKRLLSRADDSASRFALMTAEYSQKCKVLLETPEVRIAHWVKVEQDAAAAAPKKGPMIVIRAAAYTVSRRTRMSRELLETSVNARKGFPPRARMSPSKCAARCVSPQ